jgi:hypothetical protein
MVKKTHPGMMLRDEYNHYDYNYDDNGNNDD